MTIPNRQGRAFEYCVVDFLIKSRKDIKVTQRLRISQKRDRVKFTQLPTTMQNQFIDYAKLIKTWLEDNFDFSKGKIIIDRLSDHDAKQGDVTDIKLNINNNEVNLSLKHRHDALKHPRPAAIPIRCGYSKESIKRKIRNIIL